MKQIYLWTLIGFWLVASALSGVAQESVGSKINQAKIEQSNEIKIFPNPATDQFKINIRSGTLKYITINNIIGKEIRKVYSTPDHTFEVSDLKRGVYIIRIFDHKDELVKALRLSKA